MATSSPLQPELVRSLSTKFFYKGERMHFLITLLYGEHDTVLLKEYDTYDAYRTNHDILVKALNNAEAIPDNFARL